MKKLILTAASIGLSGLTASANWITGEPAIMAVNQGEAAFHISLSSNQLLDANLASSTSLADVIFTNKSSKGSLALTSLPLAKTSGTGSDGAAYEDAELTITPLVNDGNGQRFYLISTGPHDGAHIVAYSKGNFTDAFSSASLDGETGSASFEVTKKEILLHFQSEAGTTTYKLTYQKDGTFAAEK